MCSRTFLLLVFIFGLKSSLQQHPKIIDLGYGYILGDEHLSHASATTFCDFVGKELVSIQSLEEDKLILSLLRASSVVPSSGIWTSGTNFGGLNPRYRWGNEEPMFYTRWRPEYPKIDSTNCVYLGADSYDRLWYTISCSTNFYALCENKTTLTH